MITRSKKGTFAAQKAGGGFFARAREDMILQRKSGVFMQEDDFSPVALGDPQEETADEADSVQSDAADADADIDADTDADDVTAEEKEEYEREENNEAEEPKPKKKRRTLKKSVRKKLLIALAAVVGAAAVTYVGGTVYYSSRFFNGTAINNFDCSNLTVEEAQKAIMDGITNYVYTLYERDGAAEYIHGSEVGLKLETIGDISAAKANQNPFLWFCGGDSKNQAVNIIVSLDEDALYQKVQSLNCVTETRSKAADAVSLVTYDEEQQCFVLINPDAVGENAVFSALTPPENDFSDTSRRPMNFSEDVVNTNRLFECVKTGMYGLYHDMTLETEKCYITIAEESNIKQALDTMNKYISANISYQNGDEIIPLDRGSIHFWVSVDSNFSVYLDEAQVEQFVVDLSSKYNTIGSSRTFTSSAGGEVTVYGGDYGWQLDVSGETQALCEIIRNGETVTREPLFKQKAATHGAIDFGNTYVEITIGGQHLWFYKDGQLIVSSDMVSGNPNAGNGTPTGVYMLKYKERNATLVGEDYRTPVDFWMPFNGGVGMHDATWRGAFGGTIYIGGGSHGCINLPHGVAQTIYENIESGDPVIVY